MLSSYKNWSEISLNQGVMPLWIHINRAQILEAFTGFLQGLNTVSFEFQFILIC